MCECLRKNGRGEVEDGRELGWWNMKHRLDSAKTVDADRGQLNRRWKFNERARRWKFTYKL